MLHTVARRVLVLCALVLGLGAAAMTFALPAEAHAMVVASFPADGAHLARAPAQVSITFDEPVGIDAVGYLHVVNDAGTRVDVGAAAHPGGNGARIAVDLRSGLGAGEYVASYRVISADSHPVTGVRTFTVGTSAVGGVPARSAPATDAATGAAFDAAQWVSFAGVALLGGGWIAATVWPGGRRNPRVRGLAQAGAWLIAIGAITEILVEGPYAAGTGLGHVTDPALVRQTLHSTFGSAHVWRLGLVAALSYVVWTPRRWRRWLTGLSVVTLSAGIAVTFAASGHAWSAHPRWVAVTSDSIHLLAMAAWLGGLLHILVAVLPSRDTESVRAVLPTFSRVAFGCVVVLAATGLYQAVLGVVDVAALTPTRYGQLVIAKVLLFAAMVAAGNASRALVLRGFLAPRAHAHSWADVAQVGGVTSQARGVRRVVLGELAIGGAVLVATAVLVAQPPGDVALVAQHQRPHTVTATVAAGQRAAVTIAPQLTGPVTVRVHLDHGPSPLAVSATAALPAAQLGPIPLTLARTGVLTYTAEAVMLPAPGEWIVSLDVQSSEFQATTVSVRVHVF